MPININDGFGVNAVGKIYEFAGTGYPPIAKAYIYDGSAYPELFSGSTPLFVDGVWNTDLLGAAYRSSSVGGGVVTFADDLIKFTYRNDASLNKWSHAIVWSSIAVDLTEVSSINATIINATGSPRAQILINPTRLGQDDNPQNHSTAYATLDGNGQLSLDVSQYTGSYYIAFDGTPNGGWNYSGSHAIQEAWLE